MAALLGRTIGALLFLAAVWFALYVFDISAAAPPPADPALSDAENLRVIFAYHRTVAWQEYGYGIVAALAFLLFSPFGALLKEVAGGRAGLATMAASLFALAAALLVMSQLVLIGVTGAILEASVHEGYDPLILDVIEYTGSVISDWIENGGFVALALAFVAWASIARALQPARRTWSAMSYVLAGTLLVLVVCQALGIWTVYDIALALSGAVLAPIWFVMAARACESIPAPS